MEGEGVSEHELQGSVEAGEASATAGEGGSGQTPEASAFSSLNGFTETPDPTALPDFSTAQSHEEELLSHVREELAAEIAGLWSPGEDELPEDVLKDIFEDVRDSEGFYDPELLDTHNFRGLLYGLHSDVWDLARKIGVAVRLHNESRLAEADPQVEKELRTAQDAAEFAADIIQRQYTIGGTTLTPGTVQYFLNKIGAEYGLQTTPIKPQEPEQKPKPGGKVIDLNTQRRIRRPEHD